MDLALRLIYVYIYLIVHILHAMLHLYFGNISVRCCVQDIYRKYIGIVFVNFDNDPSSNNNDDKVSC